MSRIRRIRDHYEPRISSGRENFDIVDWADKASQQARFAALAENVDLAGKSLLDVGCGLGDLLAFLIERSLEVRYTGVDIVEEMIAAARRRHPSGRFVHADPFADKPFGHARASQRNDALQSSERFDVLFCSGVFNLDLGNNRRFLPAALPRIFDLAREHVVLNFLHARTPDRYEHCVYYDPQEVLSLVGPMAREVRLVDDYLPNDFTIICRI